MSDNREGCCAQYRKPCSYHEGWKDAEDAMDKTIECPTCGGLGFLCRDGHVHDPCPDCIRGRQPSPEVLRRMAKAIATNWPHPMKRVALAAWLAEWRDT
jgi:hypothetical protein